jgi:hypothetical protein
LASVPWIAAHFSRKALVIIAILLWLSYLLARLLNAWRLDAVTYPLELATTTWMGVLLLLFFALLAVDAITLGGWLAPRLSLVIRGGAVVGGLILSAIALSQGFRPPVVVDYTVTLAGLPRALDGLTMVVVSDLHLGTLIGQRWLGHLVSRVNGLKPDLVAAVGDVLDGNGRHTRTLVPVLAQLQAPLGVWAVTGNHEYYAGLEESVALLEAAGWHLLRDRSAEVTRGLVLAGVDDLTARGQVGEKGQPLEKALSGRPPGATIFFSHSPWEAEKAAALGAGLMLSGHTHAGQIWPFNFLVGLRYPLLGGRYEVSSMPVIVCRGTGTWGPRMRLWRPGEVVRIRLEARPDLGQRRLEPR